MPATNPNQLVEEFKKSGNFDRLRRELFAEFQKGDHIPSFDKKTQDVVQQRFASMKTRSFLSTRFNKDETNLRTELLQEIQRYPYVETTVNDMPTFSDQTFNDNLTESIMRILKEEPNENTTNRDVTLTEKEINGKLDSPRDSGSGHSEQRREEEAADDSSVDKKEEEEVRSTIVQDADPGSTVVNGLKQHPHPSPQPSVNDTVSKEPGTTMANHASLTPPSLTRRSSSNLSSLSSVSSRSPSLLAEVTHNADEPTTTARVPDDDISLSQSQSGPEPVAVADVPKDKDYSESSRMDTVQDGDDSIRRVEPIPQQGSEDNPDVVIT
ncbi:hypothetical protein FB446DRAFT_128489 [Lentinula raphanica]|nr:hypothetical protein FB446DRAFT_128489 [Lentinula raphanica]